MPGLTQAELLTAARDVLPPDILSWLLSHQLALRPHATLVLWDMPNLLVPCPELDIAAHHAAFRAVMGRWPDTPPRLDAGTDPQIALDLLMANGVPRGPAARMLPRLLPELIRHARDGIARCALPGPATGTRLLLEQVAAADGMLQSVITRDLRGIAVRKLRAVGLDRVIAANIGGYGSDYARLDRLIEIARARAAQAHRVLINPAEIIVVSHSPVTTTMARRAGASVADLHTGQLLARVRQLLAQRGGVVARGHPKDTATYLDRLAHHGVEVRVRIGQQPQQDAVQPGQQEGRDETGVRGGRAPELREGVSETAEQTVHADGNPLFLDGDLPRQCGQHRTLLVVKRRRLVQELLERGERAAQNLVLA